MFFATSLRKEILPPVTGIYTVIFVIKLLTI